MMLFVRFGLVFWLIVRVIFVLEKLRTRFAGAPLEIDGTALEYKVLRNKGSVTGVKVGIAVPDTLRFLIRHEKYWDRVAKQLGVASEFQTGDRQFDSNAYIVCDDQTLLIALATHPKLRQEIHDMLVVDGARAVRCNAGRLWVECKPDKLASRKAKDPEIGLEIGKRFAPRLAAAKAQLAEIRAQRWDRSRDLAFSRESIFYGFTIGLALLGIVAYFYSLGIGMPRALLFDNAERLGIYATVDCVALFVAAAVLFLRGTSRLHLVLLEIFITMTPAAWYVARTAYIEQNIRQDVSARQEEVLRIESRYTTRRKNGLNYWITVDRWPDARIDRTLQVNPAVYSGAVVGQCMRVGFHRGHYHDPWIDSMQPSASCETSG